MSTEALPPGGEGEVKAIFKTKGRTGKQQKKITVYSNDPDTPQLVLTLEGEVVADVEVQPRRLSFGQVSKRADASRELTLKVPEPDKIKITSVTVDDPRFELELKSGEAAGDSTYEVRFKGSDELGRIKGNVRVAFSGSEVEHIDVPLWGQIVGDLRYPENLSFYKKKDEFPVRKVTFTSRTNKPVHVLDVEDKDDHLKVDLKEAKGDKALIELSVKALPAPVDKPIRGTLVVKTTDVDQPVIEIKYGIYPANRMNALRDGLKGQLPRRPAAPRPAATFKPQ